MGHLMLPFYSSVFSAFTFIVQFVLWYCSSRLTPMYIKQRILMSYNMYYIYIIEMGRNCVVWRFFLKILLIKIKPNLELYNKNNNNFKLIY